MEKSVGYFFYIIPFIPLSHKDIQMGYLLMYHSSKLDPLFILFYAIIFVVTGLDYLFAKNMIIN
jgi:hypothetical protein